MLVWLFVRGLLGLRLIKLIVISLKYSVVYNIASLLIAVLDDMIILASSYIPGFLRVGKTNSTAGVSQQLCLSYSVLTIFIAFCPKKRVTFPRCPKSCLCKMSPIISPDSSTRREYFSTDTALQHTTLRALTRASNGEVSPIRSLA